MNRNTQAALAYARKNWKVFPLTPKTKRPLTRHGFKDATDDRSTITGWWTQEPAAGIGLATGESSGVLVIDIDPRNNGHVSFQALTKSLGPLPDTVESITGGGGRHLFFNCPNGMNSLKGWAPGVDVKAKGGYVCVPFTRHPSGTVYAWVKGKDPDKQSVADLPPSWLDAFVNKPQASRPAPGEEPLSLVIPEGARHDKLLSLAGAMRRHGASTTEIEEALLTANKKRCNPPLPDADVSYLARSLDKYQQGDLARRLRITSSAASRAATEPEEIDWMLEDRVAHGDVSLLVGPPEAGKSWLFLDLAVCVALGIPAFGHFPTTRGRVMVLDEENTQDEVDRRLYKIVKAHEASPRDLDGWLYMPDSCQGFSFRDKAWVAALTQSVSQVKPDLILIDSLVAVSTVHDEASATEVRRFFHDMIYPLRSAFKSTVVLTHHTNKAIWATERPTTGMGLIRGSIDFAAAVDSAMLLDTANQGLKLSFPKVRRGPRPKSLDVQIVDGQQGGARPMIMNAPAPQNDTKTAKARKVIVDVLATFGSKLTGRRLLELARKEFPTCDPSTMRVQLNQLRKDNRVGSARENGIVVYWKI